MLGGHGGNGLGKYGGVGGQGGAVYFVAKEKATLRGILKKYPTGEVVAGNGEDSSKLRIVGRRGADVQIEAPVGITVINPEGKIKSECILKLNVSKSHLFTMFRGVERRKCNIFGCMGWKWWMLGLTIHRKEGTILDINTRFETDC